MFYLDVSKMDRVLYRLRCDSPATVDCCSCWDGVHACDKMMIISERVPKKTKDIKHCIPSKHGQQNSSSFTNHHERS